MCKYGANACASIKFIYRYTLYSPFYIEIEWLHILQHWKLIQLQTGLKMTYISQMGTKHLGKCSKIRRNLKGGKRRIWSFFIANIL